MKLSKRFLLPSSLATALVVIVGLNLTSATVFAGEEKAKLSRACIELEEIDKALNQNDQSAELWWQRGIKMLECMGKLMGGVSGFVSLETAVGMEPNNIEYRIKLAKLYGNYHGNYEKALEHIKAAQKISPDDIEVLKTKVAIMFNREEYGDALIELERLEQLAPDDPEVMIKWAFALSGMNEREKAIEYLKRAIALDPNHARAYANLGANHEALGRYEDAKVYYTKALALAKTDRVRSFAKTRLEKLDEQKGEVKEKR